MQERDKLLFEGVSTAGGEAALGAPSGGAVTANAVTEGVSLVFRTLPQSKIRDFRQPPQGGGQGALRALSPRWDDTFSKSNNNFVLWVVWLENITKNPPVGDRKNNVICRQNSN